GAAGLGAGLPTGSAVSVAGSAGLDAAFGPGLGAVGLACDWGDASDSAALDFAGFFGAAEAAGFLACDFGAGLVFSAGAASANSARRRFTTGGSIFEDAADTNSPISSSLVSASREVIPSCLATSWTRSFATILLFWLNRGLHYLVHNRDSCRSNVCSVNDAHKAASRLAHAP